MEGCSESTPLINDNPIQSIDSIQIKVYKRRWWILFIFCVLALLQSELLQSWTVITESVKAVFCWTDNDITLMLSWTYITYILAIFFIVWLMDTKGIYRTNCSALLFYYSDYNSNFFTQVKYTSSLIYF